jgi:amino-acid racemase
MQTIGLLGGMSWESTAIYYRVLNEQTRRLRGGLHSAPIVLDSVDFQRIERLQQAGDWDALGAMLAGSARRVEAAGADLLLICSNTIHKVADTVAAAVDIPLLHLADATAERIRARGIETVGLLGTRFTMEQDFYADRLRHQGLAVLVPDTQQRELVNRVIYEELCRGIIRAESRGAYLDIMQGLAARGAAAIIEGCTEIGLLVTPQDTDLPLFDTARIHAERAVELALG